MVWPTSGSARLAVRTLMEVHSEDDLHRRADDPRNAADQDRGIGIVSFITALLVAIVVFSIQTGIFLLLRNKLARIL
jgi:hypothetical protein